VRGARDEKSYYLVRRRKKKSWPSWMMKKCLHGPAKAKKREGNHVSVPFDLLRKQIPFSSKGARDENE